MYVNTTNTELATFGAGCFWSTERAFRKQFGTNLKSAVVGYICGISTNGNEQDDSDTMDHVEVLQVSFNPSNIEYRDLVRFFFSLDNHENAQYRSIIVTHTAEQVRDEIQVGENVDIPIQSLDGLRFHMAEQKHQNYLEINTDG